MDDADRLRRDGLLDEPALFPTERIHDRIESEPMATGYIPDVGDPMAAVGDEPALSAFEGLQSFATLYPARRAETPSVRRWWTVLGMVLVAGPLALMGALFGSFSTVGYVGLFAVVLVAPITEEILKAAVPLYVAERKPWLIPHAAVIPLVTLAAGLVFAAVENLLYLRVYLPSPTLDVTVWRWVFGTTLHGTAAFISGLGIAKMWRTAHTDLRPPDLGLAAPYLIAAVILHATYNVLAVILEFTDLM